MDRRRDEDALDLLFADGLDDFWRCAVPDLDRLIAEAFPEVGGERRTTGARDANLYPGGSDTGLVHEGATRGGTQEEVQGVVRNVPQCAPKCDGAPAHCAKLVNTSAQGHNLTASTYHGVPLIALGDPLHPVKCSLN